MLTFADIIATVAARYNGRTAFRHGADRCADARAAQLKVFAIPYHWHTERPFHIGRRFSALLLSQSAGSGVGRQANACNAAEGRPTKIIHPSGGRRSAAGQSYRIDQSEHSKLSKYRLFCVH